MRELEMKQPGRKFKHENKVPACQQYERQISLGILIHEKAGTISAQSSSVIQSQWLWCEKGELTWKGRQIAEGTFI